MKNLDKLLLSHITLALIIVTLFVVTQNKSADIIPLHLIIIASMYYLAFIISRLSIPYFKTLSILLFTALSSSLVFIYLINFLSNFFFNNNVSLSFIATYIFDLDTLLADVPLATESIFLASAIIISLIYLLYRNSISYLSHYDKELDSGTTRKYTLITLITIAYTYTTFSEQDPGIWDGEPLTSLFLSTNIISYMQDTSETITFNSKASNKLNHDLKNIVLIHADALRATHMSNYGYNRDTTPFINELVNNGATQIDLGLSTCSESMCGMLAVLGSRQFDTIEKDTPLLHTHLKNAGYRTIFTGSGNFSWGNLDEILSHDIDYFSRADLNKDFSIHDDSIILETLSKMPEYSGVPTFLFLRFLSAHQLGRHFSQYQKFTPSDKNLLTYLFPSLDSPMTVVNAYDNHVLQQDDFIKKALTLLEKKGYMENSIVVIYGDHGEALNEHGYYGHYKDLYQEEIHVPIIFTNSDDTPIQEKSYATLDDIFPTLLDMNNLEIPDDIRGLSLLDTIGNRTTFHESRTGIYAVIQKDESGIYKLILNTKTDNKLLYNLRNDPNERNNLYTNDSEDTKVLLDTLTSYFNLL